MSDDKATEAELNKLVSTLNKSTNSLTTAILKTPMGGIESLPVEIEMDDDEFNDPRSSMEDIRESNRTSAFEITSIEGSVIILSVDRARTRVRNKLSGWVQSQKTNGIVYFDDISISTKTKFKNKISRLVQKMHDGELNFPIKLSTSAGNKNLDESQLTGIHNALENHDAACDVKEQEVLEAINSAIDLDSLMEILINNKIKL